MAKETFMLVSLKEDKAKKLAQVITNPTCRKILDYLANKEATETEIAKALDVPLSTVHYNLVQLKESKLVEVDEFHYSSKGKEVDHYKLANKYIIIAPKESSSSSEFIDKLKSILPAFTILGTGIAIWQYLTLKSAQNNELAQPMLAAMPYAAPSAAATEGVGGAQRMMAKAAPMVADAAKETVISESTAYVAIWPYFVYGAIAGILIYVMVDLIRKKLKSKSD